MMNPTHALIHAYLDDRLSDAECAELADLLIRDPAACDAFARWARFEDSLAAHVAEERAIASVDVAAQRRERQIVRLPLRKRWLTYVAAAAVLLALGLMFSWPTSDVVTGHRVISGHVLVNGVAASQIPDGSRVEVLGSEVAQVQLADGSVVDLEPATAVVFRTRPDTQQVELDAGGGQFHVARRGGTVRVETPGGSILGRASDFSVRLNETKSGGMEPMSGSMLMALTVAVMAGQVQVESAEPGQKYTVKSGEKRDIAFEKKLSASGKVVAVSSDGKSITIEGPAPKPGADPANSVVEISEGTELVYYGMRTGGDKPTVGYRVVAWLDRAAPTQATRVEFGEKEPALAGAVAAVSENRKQITIDVFRKTGPPEQRPVTIDDKTRQTYEGVEATAEKQPTVGYQAQVWLDEGRAVATEIKFISKRGIKKDAGAPPADKPKDSKTKIEKPAPETKKPSDPKPTEKPLEPKTKTDKPSAEMKKPVDPKPSDPKPTDKKTPEKKPQPKEPSKPAEPPKDKSKPSAALPRKVSTRDFAAVSTAIDREIDAALATAQMTASPAADDAEFLRRVTLDITGRIPTYQRTLAFLESSDPHKRRQLIDELLASPEYGQHFGHIWRRLIVPRDDNNGKPVADRFSPWLAEQFNANRGWSEIVYDLLTADGDITRDPQATFMRANTESFEPKANLLAASATRLFLGVQLNCAECHNHPYAEWKQTDFWSTAAFFQRVRRRSKGDFSLTEEPTTTKLDGSPAPAQGPGASIVIPESAGKAAGQVVPARFLQGDTPQVDESRPLRPTFATWATAKGNPFFARAAVNRVWAQFFGRGFVNPVDHFHADNPPSHPALLEQLAAEFEASGHDLQHLIRTICNSQAYQRTSRPLAENESDKRLFSHQAIKVMTPDVFYDSVNVVLNAEPQNTITFGKPGKAGKGLNHQIDDRVAFVTFFSTPEDPDETGKFGLGIPQLLRMMNAQEFNAGATFTRQLAQANPPPNEAIEKLYLVALARRPSSDEARIMADYVAGQQNLEQALSGALWILLNTSEFVLNR
jgi:ferric-dicitrate binding protein FerR (iron transport regulator)